MRAIIGLPPQVDEVLIAPSRRAVWAMRRSPCRRRCRRRPRYPAPMPPAWLTSARRASPSAW